MSLYWVYIGFIVCSSFIIWLLLWNFFSFLFTFLPILLAKDPKKLASRCVAHVDLPIVFFDWNGLQNMFALEDQFFFFFVCFYLFCWFTFAELVVLLFFCFVFFFTFVPILEAKDFEQLVYVGQAMLLFLYCGQWRMGFHLDPIWLPILVANLVDIVQDVGHLCFGKLQKHGDPFFFFKKRKIIKLNFRFVFCVSQSDCLFVCWFLLLGDWLFELLLNIELFYFIFILIFLFYNFFLF